MTLKFWSKKLDGWSCRQLRWEICGRSRFGVGGQPRAQFRMCSFEMSIGDPSGDTEEVFGSVILDLTAQSRSNGMGP